MRLEELLEKNDFADFPHDLERTALKDPQVSLMASTLASNLDLRMHVTHYIRSIVSRAEAVGVVVDGRDIGSVVLPQADLKIFLHATLDVRARRRWDEMGQTVDLDLIKADIAQRDAADYARTTGALQRLPDAWDFDTSDESKEQVVETIIARVNDDLSRVL